MRKLTSLMVFSLLVFLLIGCEEAPSTYTVTYQDYDGSIIATYDVLAGDDAPLPTDPTREGYTFSGWDPSHLNISSDMTLQEIGRAHV